MLGPVVRQLKARDRRIVYLRFFEQRSQQEIADEIGVTQMQVSRLLARILRDLRKELTAEQQPAGSPRPPDPARPSADRRLTPTAGPGGDVRRAA